jgi:hypothetical protein
MTFREAMECAKIFIPRADALRGAKDGIDLLQRIYDRFSAENPVDLLRAVSLMEHASLDATVEKYRVLGGENLLNALAEHFQANPLPDLIQAAAVIGLADEGWSYA